MSVIISGESILEKNHMRVPIVLRDSHEALNLKITMKGIRVKNDMSASIVRINSTQTHN